MKKVLFLFFTLCSTLTYSQYQMDLVTRQSTDRSISQKIGFTNIEIRYGSPMLKNRIIWGEVVAYNQVWRAGANWATTISFSEPVIIDGQSIDKGTYSLFVIPRKQKRWTIILNSIPRQWGAFKYDSTKDLVRVDILPRSIPKQEKLVYEIDNYSSELALVQLKWGEVLLQLPIEIDMIQPLDSLMIKKSEILKVETVWVAYLQAAELLLKENQGMEKALEWITKSEKLATKEMDWHPQYYPKAYIMGHLYWTKARINGELGKKESALTAVTQMKSLENPTFYEKEAEAEEMEKYIEQWKN